MLTVIIVVLIVLDDVFEIGITVGHSVLEKGLLLGMSHVLRRRGLSCIGLLGSLATV